MVRFGFNNNWISIRHVVRRDLTTWSNSYSRLNGQHNLGGGLRVGSHGFSSHLRSIYAILAIESMEVETYHCTRHDVDVYMATLFGGEARDLC